MVKLIAAGVESRKMTDKNQPVMAKQVGISKTPKPIPQKSFWTAPQPWLHFDDYLYHALTNRSNRAYTSLNPTNKHTLTDWVHI